MTDKRAVQIGSREILYCSATYTTMVSSIRRRSYTYLGRTW